MSGGAKEEICKGIETIGFSHTVSSAGVIKISFNTRASFSNVDTCIKLCRASASKHSARLEMSISAFRKDVLMSVRVGGKRPLESGPHTSDLFDGKEEFYDRVDSTIDAISKLEKEDSKMLLSDTGKAKDILYRSEQLKSMDGGGERAIQSFGLFKKKLPGNEKFHLLIAMRINTGTAIKLDDMIRVLGDAWTDGALTTEDKLDGIDNVELPLSEEAKVSLEHGNHPLLIITTVPV
jgi:hypothetical protein